MHCPSFFPPYTYSKKNIWAPEAVTVPSSWEKVAMTLLLFLFLISINYLFFCGAFVKQVSNTIEWLWRDLVIVSSEISTSQTVPILLRLWTVCSREYLYLDFPDLLLLNKQWKNTVQIRPFPTFKGSQLFSIDQDGSLGVLNLSFHFKKKVFMYMCVCLLLGNFFLCPVRA